MTKSPWLTIWLSPRETIREIANIPSKGKLFILAYLSALNSCFAANYALSAGGVFFSQHYLIAALILSPLIGYLVFLCNACLFYFSGRILKGNANFSQVFRSIAWASVPSVIGFVFWSTFYLWMYLNPFNPNPVVDFLIYSVPKLIVTGCIVLTIAVIKEVQGFSTLRSIGSYLLAVVFPMGMIFSFAILLFCIIFGFKYILS